MESKSSTRQDGEPTTGEVPGSIVKYTEEKIDTFKDDMASGNKKKCTSTSVNRLQPWYLEKYKTTVAHKGHCALSHNIFWIVKYAFQIMHNTFQIPQNALQILRNTF